MSIHTYKYEVREGQGQISTGLLQASSLIEASTLLRRSGRYVVSVVPLAGAGSNLLTKLRDFSVEFGPGLKDILNFTTQLAVMIKAGINIRDAIGGIADQIENVKFKKMVEQIKMDVESGKPFSQALSRYPKVFSPLYINMVKASEMSGNFGQMLDRVAMYLAQQVEVHSMVRGAMIYPAIIGTMAVVTTIFLLTFVLPRFKALFAGKESLLPAPTRLLNALSDFMVNRWYIIVSALVIFIWSFVYAIHTKKGRQYWDWFKLHVPLFKKMFRALYITRGLHTMGELINAGVPMLDTLNITAEISGNILYRRMWQNVHLAVKQGNKIAQPLQKQAMLPKNVVQMVSAGEESGKLGEVLRDISEFYAKELKNTIKSVTAMIEPLMIVLMGGVVGFIAMSIILPIFKMSSLVK